MLQAPPKSRRAEIQFQNLNENQSQTRTKIVKLSVLKAEKETEKKPHFRERLSVLKQQAGNALEILYPSLSHRWRSLRLFVTQSQRGPFTCQHQLSFPLKVTFWSLKIRFEMLTIFMETQMIICNKNTETRLLFTATTHHDREKKRAEIVN